MGGATNCPETPRQKMIGMMYLVLTAMLAMNVSADILAGFAMVTESLNVNTRGSENRNKNVYVKFEDLYAKNKVKIGPWLDKANQVKKESKLLYDKIQALKIQIVKYADGEDSEYDKTGYIEGASNLDASGWICVEEGGPGQGIIIKTAIENYRKFLLNMVQSDTSKVTLINKTFYTGEIKNHLGEPRSWEVSMFDMMPLAAVNTLLTKIQADIRATEGEVITFLKSQVDADDFRVNKIEALVIPSSKYVIQNGKYSAQIILAASDSTQKPQVYIGGNTVNGTGGTIVEDGIYERTAGSIGDQKYAGYIRVSRPDGSSRLYPFESEFTVGAPSATISADKMNVFYAGIDNDVSVSVPGVASSAVSATMSGGSLVKKPGGGYIARPAKVGQECVITASAKIDGRDQKMGAKNFRVKMLPPPVAFIPFKEAGGNLMKYKGMGNKIDKTILLTVTNLNCELDDADIEARFDILSFEVNITEAMGTSVEASNGDKFTEKQLAYVRKLPKGKKFFISTIWAMGPDKIKRPLPPMEVIIK